jgi:hypothetical protein
LFVLHEEHDEMCATIQFLQPWDRLFHETTASV